MSLGGPLAGLLLLTLAAGCARRTEIIGRLIDGGDGPVDVPAGVEAGPAETGGGDFPDAAARMLCPPPGPLPPVIAPTGNCGPDRWCEGAVTPALFEGPARPAPARPPSILYPLANSVHPTNLPRITVQWKRALVEQTSFRLRFDAGGGRRYELFVPHAQPAGAAGPVDQLDDAYPVPEALWRFIGQQSAGRSVSLTVAAHDSLANVIDESAPVVFRFAGPVEGALYYMTTEGAGRGIQRYLFGAVGAQPLVQPGAEPYAFDCAGCHSTSRDGHVLAFAATYDGNLTLATTDQLSRPLVRPGPTPDSRALAPAVSPDGRFVVARHAVDRSVSVFSTETGARTALREASALGGRIDFPAWSPTGTELVASRSSLVGQPAMEQSALDGELVILPFDSGSLGDPARLLSEPNSSLNAFPAWSPDARWIVFTSSPAGSETLRNRQTRLRLLERATGNVRELSAATFAAGRGSKFARFAPTGLDGCRTVFIVFQSGLDYGVLRRDQPQWPQLWMSAIDLSTTSGDPSSPPVWLPFQDLQQKNILPGWSEWVPCDAACEGAGGHCDITRLPPRCVPN
jgi:hypothetical protein